MPIGSFYCCLASRRLLHPPGTPLESFTTTPGWPLNWLILWKCLRNPPSLPPRCQQCPFTYLWLVSEDTLLRIIDVSSTPETECARMYMHMCRGACGGQRLIQNRFHSCPPSDVFRLLNGSLLIYLRCMAVSWRNPPHSAP